MMFSTTSPCAPGCSSHPRGHDHHTPSPRRSPRRAHSDLSGQNSARDLEWSFAAEASDSAMSIEHLFACSSEQFHKCENAKDCFSQIHSATFDCVNSFLFRSRSSPDIEYRPEQEGLVGAVFGNEGGGESFARRKCHELILVVLEVKDLKKWRDSGIGKKKTFFFGLFGRLPKTLASLKAGLFLFYGHPLLQLGLSTNAWTSKACQVGVQETLCLALFASLCYLVSFCTFWNVMDEIW